MAYNSTNYFKKARQIIAFYKSVKTPDIPDTHIVRIEFPKNNIYISYRQWMNIKGTPIPAAEPMNDPNQLALFAQFDR
jgi:hypothetical protein